MKSDYPEEEDFASLLLRFDTLRRVVIDSSSLIYLERTGCLQALMAELELVAPAGVIRETGFRGLPITVVEDDLADVDSRIVVLAHESGIPVVSDDLKILKRADLQGIEYYNALIMLAFLLYRKALDGAAYDRTRELLLGVARYGEAVKRFGDLLSLYLLKNLP